MNLDTKSIVNVIDKLRTDGFEPMTVKDNAIIRFIQDNKIADLEKRQYIDDKFPKYVALKIYDITELELNTILESSSSVQITNSIINSTINSNNTTDSGNKYEVDASLIGIKNPKLL